MLNYIIVMLGGALGTGARFWTSGIVAGRVGEFFPLGTLVVNVAVPFLSGSSPPLQIQRDRFLCRRGFDNSS
jgi:fluoride ion exporter CrcB/FEX